MFFTVSGKLIARIAAEDIAQDLVTNIAFPDFADFDTRILFLGATVIKVPPPAMVEFCPSIKPVCPPVMATFISEQN